MKTVTKQEWIDALRSGEYQQGQGRLVSKNDGGYEQYCCLGVLCSLAGLEKVNSGSGESFKIGYSRWTHVIPFDEFYQLFADDILFPIDSDEEFLHTMDDVITFLVNSNDSKDWTFDQIADWIEKNL